MSPRPVLQEFSTLFGMMMPEFRLAPQVPPVGMNVVIGGGTALGSAFVPAQTLAHGIELYNGLIAPRKQ